MGHSTGGLIAALWAARNVGRLEGLILNSPWLDLQGSAIVRTLGTPVIDAWAVERRRRSSGCRISASTPARSTSAWAGSGTTT